MVRVAPSFRRRLGWLFFHFSVDPSRPPRQGRNRPLLRTDGPFNPIGQLFAERDPLSLSSADIGVDTGSQSLGSLTQKLERQLYDHQAAAVETAGVPERPD